MQQSYKIAFIAFILLIISSSAQGAEVAQAATPINEALAAMKKIASDEEDLYQRVKNRIVRKDPITGKLTIDYKDCIHPEVQNLKQQSNELLNKANSLYKPHQSLVNQETKTYNSTLVDKYFTYDIDELTRAALGEDRYKSFTTLGARLIKVKKRHEDIEKLTDTLMTK